LGRRTLYRDAALTLPGASYWIDRGGDTPEQLASDAEHNAKLE